MIKNGLTSPLLKKIAFFFIVTFTLLPLILFPIISLFFHDIHQSPRIVDGVLDLDGYDLARNREIPLDGEWEFYWNRRIVTDGGRPAQPDCMAFVPRPWTLYRVRGQALPQMGVASYRIVLKNCPEDIELLSYVPNTSISYRAYINGTLVAAKGDMTLEERESRFSFRKLYDGLTVAGGGEAELVIETASRHIGGLFLAPVLTDEDRNYIRSGIRYFFASTYIGILLVAIAAIACILLLRDKSFYSIPLLMLDLLMLLRMLVKDEFYGIIRWVVPNFNYYATNSVTMMLTLFLPVIFLFCAHNMLQLQISRKAIVFISVYELAFSVPIGWLAITGHPIFQQLMCTLSYLPFIYVTYRLYQSLLRNVPYALTATAVLLLIVCSTLSSNMSVTGILVQNVSMFAPTCFLFSVLLQGFIYLRKNQDLQRRAMEAENLRLRLKDSEMSLALSQIKPHFLYNALIAIRMICTREPETAAEAILQFANYLRMNMRSINSRSPIPFAQELEHIKNYTAIEKLRFQERLTIRYEIQAEAFLVPPLTIQPLVENAIKHGACKNIQGGAVLLKTFETEDAFCVEIIDNGPGFSPGDPPRPEAHGIQNVTFRLKEWMHAGIVIQSDAKNGTDVLITLPKKLSALAARPEGPA